MMARMLGIGGVAALGLGACSAPGDSADLPTQYRVVDTLRIDPSLINILVEAEGPAAETTVAEYAECAAARYTLAQGFGFARRIRTQVSKTGGNWRADAVYSISAALPEGLRTIDAEIAALNCAETGIATG